MDPTAIDIFDTERLISRLRGLEYGARLSELMQNPTCLANIVITLNRKSFAQQRRNFTGENNPLTRILQMLEPEDRITVLMPAYWAYTALHAACENNDVDSVDCILRSLEDSEQRGDILSVQWEGGTPLHAAACFSADDVLEYLLQHIQPLQLVWMLKALDNRHHDTPLQTAIRFCSKKVALKLLSYLQAVLVAQRTDCTISYYEENLEEVLCCPAGTVTQFIQFWTDVCSGRGQEAVQKFYTNFPTSAQRRHLLAECDSFHKIVHLFCGAQEVEEHHQELSIVSALLHGLEPNDRADLLLQTDRFGKTVLHMASHHWANDSVLLELLNFAAVPGNIPEDRLEEILICIDTAAHNFLHIVAHCKPNSVVRRVLGKLPIDILTKLLTMKNYWYKHTPLHKAVDNADGDVLLSFLSHLCRCEVVTDLMLEILTCTDKDGGTFLHMAAQTSSAELIKKIVSVLPQKVSKKLSKVKNLTGLRAYEVVKYGLKKDYMEQMGSMITDIYPLETPPKALIFYRTNNRSEAVPEKDRLEGYFDSRNIPYVIEKDPTSEVIKMLIAVALSEESLSGLMVFVMAHGSKGNVHLDDGNLPIQHILDTMASAKPDIPKMLVVQACQGDTSFNNTSESASNKASGSSPSTSSDLDGPIPPTSQFYSTSVPTDHNSPDAKPKELHRDNFLLLMATVSGYPAKPNVMMPCLVESMETMRPSTCLSEACALTNSKIDDKLREIYTGTKFIPQTSIYHSTLKRKFCLGKIFP